MARNKLLLAFLCAIVALSDADISKRKVCIITMSIFIHNFISWSAWKCFICVSLEKVFETMKGKLCFTASFLFSTNFKYKLRT